jgi:NAD-dependent dihydropyrimidine dehydrogenase PreA subunit
MENGASTCVTLYDLADAGQGDRAGLGDLVAALLDGGLQVRVATTRDDQAGPASESTLQAQWRGGAGLRRTAGAGDRAADDDSAEVGMAEFLSEACRLRVERCGSQPEWPAWFPVLDRQRCTDCKQCLNFCLFDVYAVDDAGHVQVRNPQNCKNDCPACARVCPEAAIIFPKYPDAPINGAEVDDADIERESMTADLPSLLQGGVADALRRRGDATKKRFSKDRDKEQALKERCDCLVQLQGSLGVPPQVIENISMDELRTKAADKLASQRESEAQRQGDECS